eukprot:m.85867 g.85867  ORF g.85867 m.85867 type:complete len:205 (+) comp16367_c0_seq1:310-924(+)
MGDSHSEKSDTDIAPLGNAEHDVFRDTALRYLGYANELGEAFKNFIPRGAYIGTYLVATSYCCADSSSKGYDVWNRGPKHERIEASAVVMPSETGGQVSEVLHTTVETLVWQGLASVLLPGLVINRVVWTTGRMVTRYAQALPSPVKTMTPTVTGLATIPVIIKPIDKSVDYFMETVYNPLVDRWRSVAKSIALSLAVMVWFYR